MAFKIGNKIAITDNSVFNVTDTSDSDGGIVNSREGNINLDLSTGSIFEIVHPGPDKARLKEKLTFNNWPESGQNKKISLFFNGRGSPRTSTTLSSFGTPSTKAGNWDFLPNFHWADNGNYLFYSVASGGRMYCRRYSCPSPYDLSGFNNTNYDQNVRFDTNFISIAIYTYPSNSGPYIFNNDGTRVYFSYMYSAQSYPIYTFSLSSPYDLTSTKTLIHTYTGITDYSTDTSPNFSDMSWVADGYILLGLEKSGSPSDQVLALYLDEPYDLNTVYDVKTHTLSGLTSLSAASSIAMSYNGDKVYVNEDYYIDEYTLSTPFDVSTISASYSSFTTTQQSVVGNANTGAQVWQISLVPDSTGTTPDTYLYIGDRGTTDMVARYNTNNSAASRPTLLWDSDKISMLNDSAAPMADSGELDLFEFLVFDSATGAFQTEFINNMYNP